MNATSAVSLATFKELLTFALSHPTESFSYSSSY